MSEHCDLWISSILPSRARDVGLRQTRGWEQRIYLGGAGGEEVNEENTSVCDRKMDRDRQEKEEGRRLCSPGACRHKMLYRIHVDHEAESG